MRLITSFLATFLTALSITSVVAKLPPVTSEAKTKAELEAAKAAWAEKVGLYQLCMVTDQIASTYRKNALAAGKATASAVTTPACVAPGSFTMSVKPEAQKPLESSGAHSPPGTAVSPPSTKSTAAEISSGKKN